MKGRKANELPFSLFIHYSYCSCFLNFSLQDDEIKKIINKIVDLLQGFPNGGLRILLALYAFCDNAFPSHKMRTATKKIQIEQENNLPKLVISISWDLTTVGTFYHSTSDTCLFIFFRNTEIKLSLQIACSLIHNMWLCMFFNETYQKHQESTFKNNPAPSEIQHYTSDADINSPIKDVQNPQHFPLTYNT